MNRPYVKLLFDELLSMDSIIAPDLKNKLLRLRHACTLQDTYIRKGCIYKCMMTTGRFKEGQLYIASDDCMLRYNGCDVIVEPEDQHFVEINIASYPNELQRIAEVLGTGTIDELTRLRNMEKAIRKYPDLRRAVQAALKGGYECDKKIDSALMAHHGLASGTPQPSHSAEEPHPVQPSPACTGHCQT